MKLEVTQETIRDLGNLKGRWLLRGKELHIIRDFQHVVEKPVEEDEVVPPNTKIFQRKKRRKKKADLEEITYLTSIRIDGYNRELKFVGTFHEDYCERLIAAHNHEYERLNLFTFANAWEHLHDQIVALEKFEAKVRLDKFESKYEKVIDLVIENKTVQASKAYKEIEDCSMKEAMDFVIDLQKKYVDN